jgi:hypothetical protein
MPKGLLFRVYTHLQMVAQCCCGVFEPVIILTAFIFHSCLPAAEPQTSKSYAPAAKLQKQNRNSTIYTWHQQ